MTTVFQYLKTRQKEQAAKLKEVSLRRAEAEKACSDSSSLFKNYPQLVAAREVLWVEYTVEYKLLEFIENELDDAAERRMRKTTKRITHRSLG